MKGTTETYHSYGNIFTSTAEVFKPKTLAELKELLGFCQKENRKITVAGTFNSFDKQNGSKDVVISLRHFDKISYDKNNHTITVGAGANWGDILDVVYQNKCALFTCITGTSPTAAGTLSVHSNSTWTPSVGKEGNHCLSFDIMLTNGKVLTCSRTENQDLFYGAISGLGILGFITQITYQVFYIGSDYQIKLATVDCNNIDNIEEKLWVRKSENQKNWKN